MSRNGSGVYSLPAGSAAVDNAIIDPVVFNTLISDLESDANTARPIVAGGTGATTAAAARTNLGAIGNDGRGFTWAAVQNTTSGGAFDFTNIPAWVTEIKLLFNGVSLTSTGDILVQLGTSSGIEASDYFASSTNLGLSAGDFTDYSSGFGIASNAEISLVGEMNIVQFSSSSWVSSHIARRRTQSTVIGAGLKSSLSGTLTRVRLTRIGAGNFDAGSVRLGYR